jgi:hypothetical protein
MTKSKAISAAEFDRRVQENTDLFRKFYKTSADPARFHFYDARAGELSPMRLLDKVHDIFGAVAIGALPLIKGTGADAMLKHGRRAAQEIELKFCKIDSSRYTVGSKDGIYLADRKARVALSASIKGQWTINSEQHLQTKNRYTVLVVYDVCTDTFVEARGLDGDIVVECLSRSKKRNGNKVITWNTFMNRGKKIDLVTKCMGYDNLQKLIRSTAVK